MLPNVHVIFNFIFIFYLNSKCNVWICIYVRLLFFRKNIYFKISLQYLLSCKLIKRTVLGCI